jgi:hypothetical protein
MFELAEPLSHLPQVGALYWFTEVADTAEVRVKNLVELK